MNRIDVNLERVLAPIDPNLFGGFAEHLGRCIYGGVYDPDSPHAGPDGLRTDVLAALRHLQMPVIRYPGGNFVSGYRWRDGVGPRDARPARLDLAWGAPDSNHFGTNEFVQFCRHVGAEPYLVVNCGDGDMREARDWVEYCNGTADTALVRLRRAHGFDAPHNVQYWAVGNEVDGAWQIGHKTPEEYTRAYVEFAKVMRWVDPKIKLLASATSSWAPDFVERAQLLLEQASEHIDYMSVHWYVANHEDDFARYMAVSELIEARLRAYEGLIDALRLARRIKRPIPIAVDEWNVWYRAGIDTGLEEVYNLEDALAVAMHLNAFIRHARTVRMANLAQIVNVIAPILTRKDGLVLQTIFYPFELYRRTCGDAALDVFWSGETFDGGDYAGVRVLDVAASRGADGKRLTLYVVNRSLRPTEAVVALAEGRFAGSVTASVVNGPDIKTANTFDAPDNVGTHEATFDAADRELRYTFEPHSVTALVCPVAR